MKEKTSPFGSWKSPITAKIAAEAGITFEDIRVDKNKLAWLEGRPYEDGRYVAVGRDINGKTKDLIPNGYNVRNAVHEYGGASYAIHDELLIFVNWDDQRLYKVVNRSKPQVMTDCPNIPRGERYSDLFITSDGKWLFCVNESHVEKGEPENKIIAISLENRSVNCTVVKGKDFYSSPRVSSDGTKLCWLEWDHPNMPWDGCELHVAVLQCNERVSIKTEIIVAGGLNESVLQPEWAPAGGLYFITDISGWWNLSVWSGDDIKRVLVETKDYAGPAWRFGLSTYSFLSKNRVALRSSNGLKGEIKIIENSSDIVSLEVPHTEITYLVGDGDNLYYIGSSPGTLPEIVRLKLDGSIKTIKKSSDIVFNKNFFSKPEQICFQTTENDVAYANYYPPTNPYFIGLENEKPPLLVLSHGGPTSSCTTALNLKQVQYFTSRGFAVVDVNYRGSTGFGKVYRDSLKGKWGVYDMDDCISAAHFLADKGLVDRARLIIKGGSAGGYTTINALTFRDDFAVGATYYGIADLSVFIEDTHKFESKYLESLIGPYSENKNLYYERSAINYTDQLSCPMIIFQGSEDKIVPPSQAEMLSNALKKKFIPYSYILFEGEQHGFRKSGNIIKSQEAELFFYGKMLGFTPSDRIAQIKIENSEFL